MAAMINKELYLVPNIVHYIWFNDQTRPLKFDHMLSILSAHKFIKPSIIYFHTNKVPTGQYWDKVRKLPELKIVHREPTSVLYGEKIKKPVFETSASDVDRVKILQEYGGIYLDLDVLVIRSFDELRKYPCTMGFEDKDILCGGIIVCRNDSFFLSMWLNYFIDDYRVATWAYNSGVVPSKLAKRYPQLLHVDKDRLNRPNFKEISRIWGQEKYNWRRNFAIHTWIRMYRRSQYYPGYDPNPESIKTGQDTFSQIARTILSSNQTV